MIAPDSANKEFATLQAKFAMLGHQLTRVRNADGTASYYAANWGLSRYLPDLEAVKSFLGRLGGSHGI